MPCSRREELSENRPSLCFDSDQKGLNKLNCEIAQLTSSRTFPKLLVVSASVYPGRGGSAIVTEKLAAQFSADEMAVIGELSPFQKPIPRDPNKPRFHYFRSRFSFFGRGSRFCNWFRRTLHDRLVAKICNVAIAERCDAILGVYPDDFFCYPACLAAERLNLPFSSYFHNTYLDNTAIVNDRAAEIQDRLFRQSKDIFVMNEGMQEFFQQQYGDKYGRNKFVPLAHTFEDYPSREAEPFQFPMTGPIRIVIFGNFNQSNLDATIRFCNALKGHNRFQVFLYSDVPRLLLKQRGVPLESVRYCGSLSDLSFNDLISKLREYHIVALTHGFTGGYGQVEYQTIFPTRTIPMLLCGRPIFIHSPPGTFLTTFAQSNEFACVVDQADKQAIINSLELLIQDPAAQFKLMKQSMQTAQNFYGPKVAQVLRNRLLSIEK
jgi:hypothetical protein